MKSSSQILSSLLILFFVNACTCNSKKEKTNEIVFENLKEGDTLVVKFAPKNLQQWFEFYSNKESTISLSDFSCSGVVLHREALKLIDTLYDKSSNRQNQLLVFSPDGHKFIDLFSVSNQTRHDSDIVRSLITPDADQQVVLGYSDGKRYELMYLGPEQVVETADWINDEQFVLTLITNENGNTIAELYLFDIKNSIFTNFRLSKKLTETQAEKQSFIEVWTKHNQKK
jgi:hypothetical protein